MWNSLDWTWLVWKPCDKAPVQTAVWLPAIFMATLRRELQSSPCKLMYIRGIHLAAFWACLEFPSQFFQYSLSLVWHKTKWIIPGLFLSSKWKLNSNSVTLWVQGGLTAAGQAITAILTYLPYVNEAVLHWLSGNSGSLSSFMQKGIIRVPWITEIGEGKILSGYFISLPAK